MNIYKTIGILLIVSVIGVLVPYTILTSIFDYPNILREDTGFILSKFYNGGHRLIWTWWAFAILGLPLLEAYILIGQKLEKQFYFMRWATTLGVTGLIVQMVGLMRWTFVVPILARNFVTGNEVNKEISKIVFQVIHQYGGVILGEHIGQLFTIAWTIMVNSALSELKIFPKWLTGLGYLSSFVYLLAQVDLFKTVMPNLPTWNLAGFIGSTLWLIWLLILGIVFLRKNFETKAES